MKICVVALGKIGLPLAVEFSKKRSVVGFDTNRRRISALVEGHEAVRTGRYGRVLALGLGLVEPLVGIDEAACRRDPATGPAFGWLRH